MVVCEKDKRGPSFITLSEDAAETWIKQSDIIADWVIIEAPLNKEIYNPNTGLITEYSYTIKTMIRKGMI